ncbi:hypothetical protein OH76DRAFT_1561623 [Lentinus brumalis]|uniref:Uncharacterized protein n=1 Tax=Lentinus brumalis TaxID=2498619 RepID=A0A371CM26_9APHY|nr:hypothetical protein OH76DRAFT_1561623 [Polyporus brumalis]
MKSLSLAGWRARLRLGDDRCLRDHARSVGHWRVLDHARSRSAPLTADDVRYVLHLVSFCLHRRPSRQRLAPSPLRTLSAVIMTVEFVALAVFVYFASWSAQAAPVSAGAILTVKEHIIPAGSPILPNIFHAQPAVHPSSASESAFKLASLSSAGSAPRSDSTVATETADIFHIPSPIPESDAPDAGTGSFLRPRSHPSLGSQANGIQPSSDADADSLCDHAAGRPPSLPSALGIARRADLESDEPQADEIHSSCDAEDGIVSPDTAGWYMGQRCTSSVSVEVPEVTALSGRGRKYLKREEPFADSTTSTSSTTSPELLRPTAMATLPPGDFDIPLHQEEHQETSLDDFSTEIDKRVARGADDVLEKPSSSDRDCVSTVKMLGLCVRHEGRASERAEAL